jgi:hypothetical protein
MACTAEGDKRMPRLRNSRAARTFPISGRSFASASAAFLADRAILVMAKHDSIVPRPAASSGMMRPDQID